MPPETIDHRLYHNLIARLTEEIKICYGERLVTFALFGSYARNALRPDSDLDLLIIANGLPDGRMKRSAEFLELEKNPAAEMAALARQNLHPYLSPIFKTPEEAGRGSLLFLDMTEEVEIFFDRDGFFHKILEALKRRLKELGSRRIWKGGMWYWVLKPDAKPGKVVSL